MLTISSESNFETCRKLWQQVVSSEQITDLWDMRECFHRNFERPLFFVVVKDEGNIVGLLPLSYIEELNYYGYFPGEIWDGKTWLEQNRIIARDSEVSSLMMQWLKDNEIQYCLRYMNEYSCIFDDLMIKDEIGYLFYPKSFNYSIEQYYSVFKRKSIKSIRKEVGRMYGQEVEIRIDQMDDFDEMIRLNIERFGTQSYFANNRFAKSFRDLRDYLKQKSFLKITTILIDGRVAAVDMGCVYKGNYTLLAGGTHPDFIGVAKLINLHHMKEACKNQYNSVDFLCGDFSWKKIFHLTPRPLYKVSNI
jgi:hypothetical protein